MAREKNIFILGAGASMPYGLPSGAALKNKILSRTSSPESYEYIAASFRSKEITAFNKAFGLSGINSIDLFLSHPGNEPFAGIGKFAIALEIAKCENTSDLLGCANYEQGLLFEEPARPATSQGWYKYLWNTMVHDMERFQQNGRYAFITFNYDRSLEEFLKLSFLAMNSQKTITRQVLCETLNEIQIIHVHGMIAPLPWQANALGAEAIGYGENDNASKIRELSDGIRIISESKEEDPDFVAAQKLIIENPEARLLFMGFGFHSENLMRLGLDHLQRPDGRGGMMETILSNQRIYATTLGINQRRLDEISSLMSRTLVANTETCHSFIQNYI